jgi:glycosyltransferase involved in cell wall biosynthesis
MNSIPEVSVIIPNYNHALFLKQRIDSVLNQSFQDFEIVILDDYSTDSSREIIEQYRGHPKVSHIIYNEKNSGSSFRQWQKGIELSKGKYIWIAESDDYCAIDFLEKMISILEQGAGVAYCRSARVENNNVNKNYFWPDDLDAMKWKRNYFNQGFKEISEALIYRNTIPNASACIFRKDIVDFNKSITDFKYAGDWLFWIYLLKNSSIGFVSESLNFFRIYHQSTRTIKDVLMEKKRFEEYFCVIDEARKLCKKEKINPNEFSKYDWLFEEYWAKRKTFGIKSIILPFFSVKYYRLYYLYIAKKLFKKG